MRKPRSLAIAVLAAAVMLAGALPALARKSTGHKVCDYNVGRT